jgi:excisionase family DNA binding protein
VTPGPDDPATTSSGAELTGEEAVEFLNVSREHLVRLLDAGEIPQHWTEQGRRLRQADLVAYRERRHQESLEALRALADLSQEHDLGY